MSAHRSVARPRAHGQRGFTLIELVVTMSLLTLIAGAMGTAYTVGIKVIGRGGAGDRLAAVHDISSLEQSLARDVGAASCIETTGTATYGGCTQGFTKVTACSASVLCVGWPQLSDLSCHVAVYTKPASGINAGEVLRTEYAVTYGGSTASSVSSFGVSTRGEPLTVQFTPAPTTATTGGVSWVSLLNIAISSTTLATPVTATLALRPIAADPGGGAASIGSSGPPC